MCFLAILINCISNNSGIYRTINLNSSLCRRNNTSKITIKYNSSVKIAKIPYDISQSIII